MKLGQKIYQRSNELKLPMTKLAEMIGKDRTTLLRYENGNIADLPSSVLCPLAKALDVPMMWLINDNVPYEDLEIMRNKEIKLENRSINSVDYQLELLEQSMAEENTKTLFLKRLRDLLNRDNIDLDLLSSEIGDNIISIREWIKDDIPPQPNVFVKIANYYDITLDYLLGRTDNLNPKINKTDDVIDAMNKDTKLPIGENTLNELSIEDLREMLHEWKVKKSRDDHDL